MACPGSAGPAVAQGATALGMAGGDGSLGLVAEVAARHDVPMVVVPPGTRNHLAMDLGLDRGNVLAGLDAFDAAVERRIDLGQVNGRVFVNNVSLGLYAQIIRSPEYREAKMETTLSMLPGMLGPGPGPSTCASLARRGSSTPPRTSSRSRTTPTGACPPPLPAGRGSTAAASG